MPRKTPVTITGRPAYDERFHIVRAGHCNENTPPMLDCWHVFARCNLVATYATRRDAIAFAIRNSTPDFWE